MRLKILIFVWLLLTSSLVIGQVTVRIAATSDVHGALFPYDFLNDRPGIPSLASLQTFLDSVRALPGNNLVLLDNGDLIQGTPAAYYANFVRNSKTNLFAEVLNYMQYDAASVGNHDIEAGPDVYYRLQREFSFPWLGANIIRTASGEPAFEPYTIIERSGIRIAVLGLITPGVPNWLPKTLWPGLEFRDLVESARYWTAHIREKENPDAIIGLFHTGYGQAETESSSGMPENAGLQAALQVPGLDLVILGHDHRPRSESVTSTSGKSTDIVNPGNGVRNVAWAELVFTKEANSVRLISSETRVISLEDYEPSPKFIRHFRKDIRDAKKYAGKRAGTLAAPLLAQETLFGSAAFTDLIHDVQLDITGADISFTAPLTTSENLLAGRLLVRDLFKLYRYENFLYTMELTGMEVKDFLEYSSSLWFNHMQHENDHLLNFRKDALGNVVTGPNGVPSLTHPTFNFDSAAGINWEVDVSKPAGNRVRIISMDDGTGFNEGKTYRVAINSYRGSGGGGHLTRGAGIDQEKLQDRIIFTSDKDIRSMLVDYLGKRGTINPEPLNNWQVIPAGWYQKGREKDQQYFNR
jgi:2',3'-cyclic-nucleotide 2'-phosphodiesterase/3'-nucleotidase